MPDDALLSALSPKLSGDKNLYKEFACHLNEFMILSSFKE